MLLEGNLSSGFRDAGQKGRNLNALQRIVNILRQTAGLFERLKIIQLKSNHADSEAGIVHQRAAGIARLHRYADLIEARIIHHPEQAVYLAVGELGLDALDASVGKADGEHLFAQLNGPTDTKVQWQAACFNLQQGKVIGWIGFHHVRLKIA